MTAPTASERSDDAQERDQAIERLKKRQDFRGHLLVYTMSIALLWAIWLLTMPGGFPWPAIVMFGWGIGVVMNVWDVYGRKPLTEAQVRHEIDRLHKP